MLRRLVAVAALCGIGLAHADPLGDALAAYGAGDPARAATLLEPLARTGDAVAQLHLGNLYFKGMGVGQDTAKALHWATQSAAQGLPEAMFLAGKVTLCDPRLLTDSEEAGRQAAQWFVRASRQGHVEAQYTLGLMFFTGKGVREDRAQAMRWFQRAAKGGKKEAVPFLTLASSSPAK